MNHEKETDEPCTTAWAKVMDKTVYRNKFLGIQRKVAILITGVYRTTSTKALIVIAKSLPIDLLPGRVNKLKKIEKGVKLLNSGIRTIEKRHGSNDL